MRGCAQCGCRWVPAFPFAARALVVVRLRARHGTLVSIRVAVDRPWLVACRLSAVCVSVLSVRAAAAAACRLGLGDGRTPPRAARLRLGLADGASACGLRAVRAPSAKYRKMNTKCIKNTRGMQCYTPHVPRHITCTSCYVRAELRLASEDPGTEPTDRSLPVPSPLTEHHSCPTQPPTAHRYTYSHWHINHQRCPCPRAASE